MEIIQTTKIILEDAEINALQTLKESYLQCLANECLDCDVCPLYVEGGCIGSFADTVLENQKRGK